MVKLRTMVVDAERLQPPWRTATRPTARCSSCATTPGSPGWDRFFRRFSIDELPQLWNVVRGQMSLVGPRPPLPGEVDRYDGRVSRRLLVKPGVTGLWQVSGRSDLSWDEAVRLDLYYVDHWSPTMDVTIILKTFSAVIRGAGAY